MANQKKNITRLQMMTILTKVEVAFKKKDNWQTLHDLLPVAPMPTVGTGLSGEY